MRRGKYEKVNPPVAPVLNVAMCLALVLFSLVAVTVYLAQGLYARYITQDTGSDSARVIKFGQLILSENGVPNAVGQKFTCIPGVDIEKDITVSFTASEADVFVFVQVDTTDWEANETHTTFTRTLESSTDPLVSWSVADGWTYLCSDTEGGNTYRVYYKLLKANTALTDSPFIAGKENHAGGVVSVRPATRAEYAAIAGQEFTIQVTAYAVQANGFTATTEDQAAMAAWEAVKN